MRATSFFQCGRRGRRRGFSCGLIANGSGAAAMIRVNEITPENDSCYGTGDSPMRTTVRPEPNRGGADHVCSSFFCCNNEERPRAQVVPTRKGRRLTSLIVWKLIDCKPKGIWIAMVVPLAPSSLGAAGNSFTRGGYDVTWPSTRTRQNVGFFCLAQIVRYEIRNAATA